MHHKRYQCSSLGLIIATWQALTVAIIQKYTIHHWIPSRCDVYICLWVTVSMAEHHQNTERLSTVTHLTLRTLEGGGGMLTYRKKDIKQCNWGTANSKDRLLCWFYFYFSPELFLFGSVCHFLLFPCLNVTMSLLLSDDNFSDSLSQKADSEASSGHAGEDKCSGKDISSPTDTRISEAYIARYAEGETFSTIKNRFRINQIYVRCGFFHCYWYSVG